MEIKKEKSVIVFGVGSIGGWVLELLARSKGLDNIVVSDIKEDFGYRKTNSTAIGAAQEGYFKRIEFKKCDVFDVDRTAELLNTVNPDVIYNGMSLPMTLGAAIQLPEDIARKWVEHYAITIPINLVPAAKLMKAVKKANIKSHVINNAFPDIINPILWKKGLGPLVGAGNIDNRVGEIKRRICLEEKIAMDKIDVYMIAEHALMARNSSVPYFLKIIVNGQDITKEITHKIGISELLSRFITFNYNERDRIGMSYMASSAVKNIMAIINNTNEFTHAPGPNGLIGGYPVRINSKGVSIELPKEISMEEAIKINTDTMKYEGVEEIKSDGTVVFTDQAREVIKDIFELDLIEIKFEDAEQIAKELLVIHEKLIKKYGRSSTAIS